MDLINLCNMLDVKQSKNRSNLKYSLRWKYWNDADISYTYTLLDVRLKKSNRHHLFTRGVINLSPVEVIEE